MTLRIELDHRGHTWRASGPATDLSVPINPLAGLPRAWYKGPAKATPVRTENWVGSTAEGGSVNFRDIFFNPHAHGTHTETREHICSEFQPVDALVRSSNLPFLLPALLLEALPQRKENDWVVPSSALNKVSDQLKQHAPPAVILRCTDGDVQRDWSNSNPPYLDQNFAEILVRRGVQHLLLDLPSVDREVDSGVLRAHHAFFFSDGSPREGATISELLRIPKELPEGLGLLSMQVSPFVNDAAPSRPLWFPASVVPQG